jgi:hypothetical protein
MRQLANPLSQQAGKWLGYPAQAGIQRIYSTCLRFCPLRGMFALLDSRLRGNDESGASGFSSKNRSED